MLRAAEARGDIPRTAVLFFAPADVAYRNDILGALEHGDAFLTKELLPWAQRFSPVPLPAQRIIAGASLGGFFTAGTVRRIPEVISHAIVQSAALWWPDHEMTELHAWQK
ncbi:hypothetical protein GWO58_07945 [Corynebacterium macginleyi]|uniref:alpha/beta hydrolase-fold protein n=1 Tax=Corynebacterium macginleyi TaxID=38290 RepID=UPI00190AE8A1|nr:alpha/beta hydrolase-fold protein [Corynebacterium macginleyi]MBK4146724.1 hypothetical protein [Corynebacterium macginleyi]